YKINEPEDFTDILRYLDHSPLRYALTHAPPVVFDSLVKQFWATAVVRPNAAGSHNLVATIDVREVIVTESLIRTQLHFNDANGIFDMPNSAILEGSANAFDTPMLAIAAAGDAADEENAAAHEAAGSTAEAHPEPHSPPVSPVRELSPERQPETAWVVPNPVSPVTDWRPWPSVPAHFPIRDTTPEPASPPTPPAQTSMVEEPLVFGPAPRPAGDVDPDVIESIIFGPQPRPDNYCEPEEFDNLFSMEDDTTHGGFHVESPVRPDDAPT
ncbi:hypothetical protein Tco_0042666, partial [Tanacetum coccineum]